MNWTLNRFSNLFLTLIVGAVGFSSPGAWALGASEAEFKAAQATVENGFRAEILEHQLSFVTNYNTKTLNASYSNRVIYLNTDGASSTPVFTPLLSEDAYVMILCHELGHAIGGLMTSQNPHTSIEGQADDFAVRVCLKRLFSNSVENADFVKTTPIDPDLNSWCARVYKKNEPSKNACLRIGTAALAVTASNVLAAEANSVTSVYPKIFTPDCSQNVLIHSFGPNIKSRHPSNQCRLDTYMRALINEPPPPCWYNVENPNNRDFFKNMDRIYGEKNVCQSVCQKLPPTVSDREREQRCLSAPCTRMLFPFLNKTSDYSVVDNAYHEMALQKADAIVAADQSFRKDCGNAYSDLVLLEVLVNTSTPNTLKCPSTTPLKKSYIDSEVVNPILSGQKLWCGPPKLGVDCTDSGLFERTLKNCGK